MREIKLGNEIECIVSGLTGIAAAQAEYLNGCVQFAIQPPVQKGKKHVIPAAKYVDVAQLRFVSDGHAIVSVESFKGHRFVLGQVLKCIVTGFKGTATARYTNMSGTVEYHLQPKNKKDNEVIKGHYLGVERLMFLRDGVTITLEDTGGEMSDCPVKS